MISGLKLKVTSKELRQHCLDRAGYHARRGNEKEAELPSLKEAVDRIKGAGGGLTPDSLARMSKGGYHLDPDSPVESLENDIRDHRNKSLVFCFFAEHLFDEDYTLEESDLVRLEVLKR